MGDNKVVYSNYYQIATNDKIPIYIYAIKSEPTIEFHEFSSEDNIHIQKTVKKSLYGKQEDGSRPKFHSDHPTSLFLNQRIYSTSLKEKEVYNIGDITIQEKTYNLSVQYKEKLNQNTPENKQVLGRLIKQHIQKVRLIKYGRKFFDPTKVTKFDNFGLSLMQGYDTSVTIKNALVILQIDACVKVTRQETYLSILKGVQQDTPEYSELVGGIVQVGYGNRQFYRIDTVDWNQTPNDKFEITLGEKKGQKQSYIEYYESRYGIRIQNPNQPLLKCIRKQRGREIELYLIPELCHPTGETKEHKSNFQLQKDLGRVKHKSASEKLRQCDDFLRHFRKDQEKNFKDWGIQIQEEPLIVESQHLQAGSLQLQQNSVNIDKGDDLDRSTQAPMYQNPYGAQGLQRVLILYSSRSQQILDQFIQQFQQSIQTMKFPFQQPRCVGINNDRQFSSWKNAIDENAKGAQMVFCILPGPKKKGIHYNDLKLYFSNVAGLFSQMILESTIKNPKGLRTVCNKLILKITSKAGGVPYKITDIPDRFSKEPTMVCGIDIYHASTKYSVIGAVCSVDQAFGKYYSHAILKNGENDIIGKLTTIFQQAIDAFGRQNKIAPKNIVVYRDGVSDGQVDAVREHEIQGMLQGIQHFKDKTRDTKLTVILVNKRIKTKIYQATRGQLNSAQSPAPGTLVAGTEINEGTNDFYLVSQKGNRQGVATPTHYKIVHNELIGKDDDSTKHKDIKLDLQILTYKLCYLYYNCTHAIKAPSPARLAHRFTNYIGDKFQAGKPETFINPKPSITQLNSLYFL